MNMNRAVWDQKTSGEWGADFDCYVAEALIRQGMSVGTLEDTLARHNVKTIAELAELQSNDLQKTPELQSLFTEVEMPLSRVLWNMEHRGIILNTKELLVVGAQIDAAIETIQKSLEQQTDGTVNLNSPTQLGEYFATKLAIPLSKTKTGKFATNEAELSKFVNDFPIIKQLLQYRELAKLRSTYVEPLAQKVDAQSRVHTTYAQIAVATGRLGSSNPNLQNIPVTSEFGLKIKSCFVASPGYTFASFDYSQQELRILAHLSQEPALIEAFDKNQDVHNHTACKLFGVSYDKVDKQQRNIAKTINFGIIYGMSSFGLAQSLNIPVEQASAFIKQFYAAYPRIRLFYDKYFDQAKINGYVETILGRRRYVFENPKKRFIDNATHRILLNYPIQGSAADLMKKAMVKIDQEVLSKHKDAYLLLQIHDDLVFEIPDNDKQTELITQIEQIMCNVHPLTVPLTVDVKTGPRWGELKSTE